jgi:hypothetical protein
MGDRVIITETEDKPKPDTIIVVPKDKPKAEKEVVVTETTRITAADTED